VLKLAGEGAHVVVNARSNQQEAETVARDLGVKAVPVLADIGNKADVEALAARALSEFGPGRHLDQQCRDPAAQAVH